MISISYVKKRIFIVQYDFGERLRKLRSDSHLTQEQLASVLNLSRSTVAYYESGMRSPDMQKLLLIADYFNISLDYLLGRTEIKTVLTSNNKLSSFLEYFFNLHITEQNFILKQMQAFSMRNKDTMIAAEKNRYE